MNDLNALSEEEKAEILRIADMIKSEGEGHPDAAADQEQIDENMAPLARVLQSIIDEMADLKTEVAELNKLVMDEIVGGIIKLHDTNKRNMGIEELRGKYGEAFGKYPEKYKEGFGKDIFEEMHDYLSKMRGGEGWDDEKEGSEINGILEKLKNTLKVDEAPALEVEVTKTAAKPEDDLVAMVNKAKKARPGD